MTKRQQIGIPSSKVWLNYFLERQAVPSIPVDGVKCFSAVMMMNSNPADEKASLRRYLIFPLPAFDGRVSITS